jgi:hypothetical protein
MIDAQWCLFSFQGEDVGHGRRRIVDEASELGGSRASSPFFGQRSESLGTAGLSEYYRASAGRGAQEGKAPNARLDPRLTSQLSRARGLSAISCQPSAERASLGHMLLVVGMLRVSYTCCCSNGCCCLCCAVRVFAEQCALAQSASQNALTRPWHQQITICDREKASHKLGEAERPTPPQLTKVARAPNQGTEDAQRPRKTGDSKHTRPPLAYEASALTHNLTHCLLSHMKPSGQSELA